jgi:small neutral amino acid transporter SnatA (MarC family)
MIHGHEDLFVGLVAVTLGVGLLTAAAINWSWYYSLRSARWLESHLTRTGARVCHGLLGLGLVALGVLIAVGWRWQLWD